MGAACGPSACRLANSESRLGKHKASRLDPARCRPLSYIGHMQRRKLARPRAGLLLLASLAACGSTAKVLAPEVPATAEAHQDQDQSVRRPLSKAWDTSSRLVFEERVRELQSGPAPEWEQAALEAMTLALNEPGPRATRAAVLLSYGTSAAAAQALLARLEQRHKAPSRALDAGDIVAAAALGRRSLSEAQVQRLLDLVQPGDPHPDLEVRVECAASALLAGAGEAAPFLLRVLRTETPAQAQDPRDWERVTTLAWAKGRASRALAQHTGLKHGFRPDGSWAHQMQSANLYAGALDLPEFAGP